MPVQNPSGGERRPLFCPDPSRVPPNRAVLMYSGGAYPARPAIGTNPAGTVVYIGPVEPTTWLPGDQWDNNS